MFGFLKQMESKKSSEESEEIKAEVIHIENFRSGMKIVVASSKKSLADCLGVADYIKKNYFKNLK